MINVIVCGANGKMGQLVASAVNKTEDMQVVAGVDAMPNIIQNDFPVFESIDECSSIQADAIVDFSRPEAMPKNLEYAKNNGRKKVTAIHKANIMKYTDGLFLECFRNVGKDYPDIEKQEVIIDNMCMQLVLRPETFDVLVAPNLYGDIVSDLCAGLVGGLGFAPSGNIGDEYRIYEAVHGSAPDIAGKGIANPSALLLAFALMLEALGKTNEAHRLREALSKVVEEGKVVTPDIGGSASTQEFTEAIIGKL